MKVHFADTHKPFTASKILLDCGAKYALQSFYGIKKHKYKLSFSYDLLNNFNHIIIDSGLFSIMFGCESKNSFTEREALIWFNDYCNWIKTTQFKNASFVECDVQKKLGADLAWELRERMKKEVGHKGCIINVYHLEDGNPDRLIDHSDYIAVSIPELRFHVSEKERYRITRYISNKAISKGKKVHLLGCTDKKMMKEFSFCTSCDSTSWKAGYRFGHLKNETVDQSKMSDIIKAIDSKYEKKSEKEAHVSIVLSLLEYKKYAGDQE